MAGRPTPPKAYPLAVGALICSVLCCIPPLPLLGIGLGIKALHDLDGTQPQLKGRELAILAIVLGGLGSFSWAAAFLGG